MRDRCLWTGADAHLVYQRCARQSGRPFPYRFTRWRGIEWIFAVHQKTMGFVTVQRFLGINFAPHYRKAKIARTLARTFGASEALMRTFGWGAHHLSALMNSRHPQAVRTARRPPVIASPAKGMTHMFLRAAVTALLLSALAPAADLSGTWTGKMPTRNAEADATFTLKAEGAKLTGTLKTPTGELPIAEGKIDGATFSFKTEGERPQSFTGTLAGDEIKMKRIGRTGVARDFVLKRKN